MSKYFIVAIALLATTVSCKKDPYLTYSDVARIQFGPGTSYIYQASYNMADTLKNQTFFYRAPEIVQDTVFFDIYAIGAVSKKDRTFKLQQEQVPGALNAIAGTHFKDFNDPTLATKYVIKAGKIHANVPVVLLRDASLKTAYATLKFKVVENSEFKLGEPQRTWRKIIMTDQITQPSAWSTYYFGNFSFVKYQFMIQQTNEAWDNNFLWSILYDSSLLKYWRDTLKLKLAQYNNAHPGDFLKDENGNFVVFP